MTWAISMTCYLSELIDRLGGTKKSRLGEKFALKSRYLIGRRSDPKRIKSRLSNIIPSKVISYLTVRNKSGKHRGSSPVFPRWGITYLINISPRTFITYVFPRSFPTKYITKLRMKYQSDVISLYLIFRSPVFPRCFPAPYYYYEIEIGRMSFY